MSRVNQQVEVDSGRIVWDLLVKSMEYAAECLWPGGRSACRKLRVITNENW